MIYVALIILIATLVIGVPVPVSFMASCAWLIFFGGVDQVGYQATQLLPYGFNQMNSVSLIAIAMFILAGGIMERGKIAEKMIDMVDVFVRCVTSRCVSARRRCRSRPCSPRPCS